MPQRVTLKRAGGRFTALALPALFLAACNRPIRPTAEPQPPLPMPDAAAVVNANVARITAALRASGSVDGHFTNPENGRRVNYSLDATLFFLAPHFVRFDLKKLGERQMLFGANDADYWFYSKENDEYVCGRQGAADDVPPEIPVRPEQIVDALGLSRIGVDPSNGRAIMHLQRVESDVQQILVVVYGDEGRPVVEKEYWLDRFPPRLVRRVVFRDAAGIVTMESFLDDYRPIAEGGPILPRRMAAIWPQRDAEMHFSVGRWTIEPTVVPGGPQFATPPQCIEPPDDEP